MRVTTEALGSDCIGCGEKKVRVSLKDPFLDDYLDVCQNDSCNLYRDAGSELSGMSASIAKQMDEELGEWGGAPE